MLLPVAFQTVRVPAGRVVPLPSIHPSASQFRLVRAYVSVGTYTHAQHEPTQVYMSTSLRNAVGRKLATEELRTQPFGPPIHENSERQPSVTRNGIHAGSGREVLHGPCPCIQDGAHNCRL
jgi:hypothetical protein